MTDWPEGVSDGLLLPCAVCENKVSFDYTVSNEAWKLVVSKEQSRNVICLTCFDKIATYKGINIAEHLKLVQFVGVNKTIGLKPVSSHAWTHLKEKPNEDSNSGK